MQLKDDDLQSQIFALLKREIGGHEDFESVRWIDVETPEGPLRALVFMPSPIRSTPINTVDHWIMLPKLGAPVGIGDLVLNIFSIPPLLLKPAAFTMPLSGRCKS